LAESLARYQPAPLDELHQPFGSSSIQEKDLLCSMISKAMNLLEGRTTKDTHDRYLVDIATQIGKLILIYRIHYLINVSISLKKNAKMVGSPFRPPG
jgi:hypothetical protein